jgi:DNA-binding GntR family transcriptional regulator
MEQPPRLLVTAPSLADQAYTVLRDLITSGELAFGERLTERALAARLGVSATPVREAISRLTHDHLLVRVDGRTLQVAAPSLGGLREMSLIQAVLRGAAARIAAESATDEELAEIERVYIASRKQRRRTKSAPEPENLRHAFHEMIVEASHNPSLIGMHATAEAFGRPLRDRAQRSNAVAVAEVMNEVDDEHEEIVAALRARDCDRAERLMREHTLSVNDRYLQFAEQHGVFDERHGGSTLAAG